MKTTDRLAIKMHMEELVESVVPGDLANAANMKWLSESQQMLLTDLQYEEMKNQVSRIRKTKKIIELITANTDNTNEVYSWFLEYLQSQKLNWLAKSIDDVAKTAEARNVDIIDEPEESLEEDSEQPTDGTSDANKSAIPKNRTIIALTDVETLLPEVRNSVFRIAIPTDDDEYCDTGTGCLVTLYDADPNGDKLHGFITNSHVLTPEHINKRKTIMLHFEMAGDMEFPLKEAKYIFISSEYCMDVTFVQFDSLRVIEMITDKNLKFAKVELEDTITLSDTVIVFQHNNSSHTLNMSIGYLNVAEPAVLGGTERGHDSVAVLHPCATSFGSSGSPVWSANTSKIVALHRAEHKTIGLKICVHMPFILKAIRLDRKLLSGQNSYRRLKEYRRDELLLKKSYTVDVLKELKKIGLKLEEFDKPMFCYYFTPADETVKMVVIQTHHGWYWFEGPINMIANHWIPITKEVQMTDKQQTIPIACPKTTSIINKLQDIEIDGKRLLITSGEEVRLDQ